MYTLQDVFSPAGFLAREVGHNYRHRPGQFTMAEAVAKAIEQEKHLLVEAGTGTGKSLAYLAPIVLVRQRAFVVTATKKLQDQLLGKEIPVLQNLYTPSMTAAALKGRSNYICLLKKTQIEKAPFAQQDEDLKKVSQSLVFQSDGDLDNINDLRQAARSRFSSSHKECTREKCPHFADCLYEIAKAKAEQADILITNHTLFAMGLQIPSFLSHRDIVVVDEAHEFENKVCDAQRSSLTRRTTVDLAEHGLVVKMIGRAYTSKIVAANERLFARLEQWVKTDAQEKSVRLDASTGIAEINEALDLAQILDTVGKHLDAYVVERALESADTGFVGQLALACHNLQHTLRQVGNLPATDWVRYGTVETRNQEQHWSLHIQPVSVSGFLTNELFDRHKTVIATSATLRIRQSFCFIRERLGAAADRVTELAVDSPFDYHQQGLVYIPSGIEPPDRITHPQTAKAEEQRYRNKVKQEIERLVAASKGRAFVLCTSTERMRWYHANAELGDIVVLLQGELSNAQLLTTFRGISSPAGSTSNHVLFGTRGFWTGVNVPGDELILVILDRVPFTSPDDPVFSKRCELLKQSSRNDFEEYALPVATLMLQQGVGRLIRSESDQGVVAILDSRLLKKRYGAQILSDLPPMRRTQSFENVALFLGAIANGTSRGDKLDQGAVKHRAPGSNKVANELTSPSNDLPDILNYRATSPIGSGGFGRVFEGVHKPTGDRVAIKMLHPELSQDEVVVQRFRAEALAVASLKHPNIVQFIEAIKHDGTYYIILEFMSGGNLRSMLRKQRQLSQSQVMEYGQKIAEALAASHGASIIHRDLKPENILFDQDRNPHLADFGIAHVPLELLNLGSALTEDHAQPGTLLYMSPEQVNGYPVDARSDLYTLGVILYEMLTGAFYFDLGARKSFMEIRRLIAEQPPIPLESVRSDLSPVIYHSIGKLLAKQREHRYQSATEFIEGLANGPTGQAELQNNRIAGQSIVSTPSDEIFPAQMSESSQHKGPSNGNDIAEGQLMDQTTGKNRRSFLGRLWATILRRGS